jgi:hypothetical protein
MILRMDRVSSSTVTLSVVINDNRDEDDNCTGITDDDCTGITDADADDDANTDATTR